MGSSCDKEVFFLFGNKVMVYKIVGAADFCDFFARLFCHAPHFYMNGGVLTNRLMTTYFRTAFVVVDPSASSSTVVEATLPR